MNRNHDLRRTAFHEAGHAVVAEHLSGAPAFVSIEQRSRDGGAWYAGRCAYAAPQSAAEQRLVSLAGACVETLDGPSRRNSGDALLRPIEAALSYSDRAGAGAFSRSDVDACLKLLIQLWPAIERRALAEMAAFQFRAQALST